MARLGSPAKLSASNEAARADRAANIRILTRAAAEDAPRNATALLSITILYDREFDRGLSFRRRSRNGRAI
jgi:hypothetical protein